MGCSNLSVSEARRQISDFRQKSTSPEAPIQRPIEALALGSSRAQNRILQEENVITEAGAGGAKVCVRGSFRMRHLLNRLSAIVNPKPPTYFSETANRVGQHVLTSDPQLLRCWHCSQEIARIRVEGVPDSLRIQDQFCTIRILDGILGSDTMRGPLGAGRPKQPMIRR